MPPAIIFDLDGCLVDSEVLSLKAIAVEAHRLGAQDLNPRDLGKEVLGLKMSRIAEWVGNRAGRPAPEDFAERIDRLLMEQYPTDLNPINGAHDLLSALHRAGCHMAVATGSSKARMALALRTTSLDGFFEGRACSADQVANGKPAPDLFLFAARAINRDPTDCVVIEDSPHGVEGALAAGMTPIGFVGGGHLEGRRDDHAETLRRAGCVAVVDRLDAFQSLVLPGRSLT